MLLAILSLQVGGSYGSIDRYEESFANSGYGSALTAADFDGDGFADPVVGVPRRSTQGYSENGVVVIYSGRTGHTLRTLHGQEDDLAFGSAVCAINDLDGDGVDDLLIGGAGFFDPVLDLQGSVFVYSGATGTRLRRINGDMPASIGDMLARAGDVNADGVEDFLLGSRNADPGGVFRTGSVFVHSGADGSMLLRLDGSFPGGEFGTTTATAGDVNGDGHADILVGAPDVMIAGMDKAGQCTVHSGMDGSILYTFDGTQAYGKLGDSVAGGVDLNGDATPDFLLGSPDADPAIGTNAGSIFVHSGADGSLLQRIDGAVAGNHLGYQLAVGSDFDGDGAAEFAATAPFANESFPNTGAVVVFSGGNWQEVLRIAGATIDVELGLAMAGGADVNGDGTKDFLVGAPEAGLYGEGYVVACGFRNHLNVGPRSLSISTGGSFQFLFDFTSAHRHESYRLLVSQSGVGPSTYGIAIPLTLDAMVLATYQGQYPRGAAQGLSGQLDEVGRASGSLHLPAGLPSTLLGRTFWAAAIAGPQGMPPTVSSVAVALNFEA
ncbi:MAG: VCBS repeat-containing protein [Planctomycetota bacterium]